ncbi:MAG: hypothetical protein EON98_06450 [Chitinophagaceae bacterium]|nr:MAG: hypothetical protein EON98_06450 [Chitinophagaceae bacterium]
MQEARRICDELNAALPTLSKPFFEAKDLDDLYDRLPFAVLFYNLIVDSTTSISKGLIEKSQGHYVDDVGLYKNAAALLRQMNRYHLGLVTQETMDSFRSMADNCNRTADTYERKADRLQEKRKQIEFLSPTGNKVFIVHGHDVGVLRELKEILRDLGVEPVILADEYDDGQTVIEKFEHHARQCALAFVLITPDDWVEKANTKYFQARPNVLFELGWFCGRYGRDNVRILRRKDTPLPSDLNGIVTIDFTERLEEVYRRIKLDMERMGVLETASAGS